MIKKIAWDTFKNTGDINAFLELKQIENIEKENQTLKNSQAQNKNNINANNINNNLDISKQINN